MWYFLCCFTKNHQIGQLKQQSIIKKDTEIRLRRIQGLPLYNRHINRNNKPK